jgi:hypothetical protein
MDERVDAAEPTDVEIGSTAGRTHAQVLEQTLGFQRAAADLAPEGPPVDRRGVARALRRDAEGPR